MIIANYVGPLFQKITKIKEIIVLFVVGDIINVNKYYKFLNNIFFKYCQNYFYLNFEFYFCI